MSAAALDGLEGLPCLRGWALEPAPFYEAVAGAGEACKGGAEPAAQLAELSAAPAMYEDEGAIDFSAYIEGAGAVPTLELCHDELFADLFNHKAAERAFADCLPAAPASAPGPGGALKREPAWSDDAPAPLPSQIAACAQTVVSLAGQPTPPTSPEPAGSASPASLGGRSASSSGRERAKKGVDRHSPEYRQRRERNNIAVRKSRDKAKRRNQEMQQRLVELSAENERLRQRLDQLGRDLGGLRRFFKQLPGAAFLPPAAADCR